MRARAFNCSRALFTALFSVALIVSCQGVTQDIKWTVIGSGSSALRDYISDGVGNATQDADLGGLYLPFYTEGTGVGASKFVNSSVDYTVGDYALSTSNYNSLGRPIVQFPLALGAVVVYHSITNYTTPNTLRLNSTVLAGIFTGKITTWDDPLILEINPNLTKATPSITGKPISVCVRTDSAGSHQHFSKYMNSTNPDIWNLGVNSTLAWPSNTPNWKYTQGGSALTALLQSTPYGIIFTDAYAGKKAKLTDSALQNKNKDWVKYTQAWWNFTSLGNDTIQFPANPADNWSNFSLINLGGNKTYPLPTAAMAASNTDLRDKQDRGAAQKQMFGYLLGPTVANRASWYQEFVLPPAFLNYSIYATSLMKVQSSLRFFEPNQLPSLGAPYSATFKLT